MRNPFATRVVLGLTGVFAACYVAQGQTSYPMLMSIEPVAVQVGTTAEQTVTSRYSMEGAYQVLVSGQGVTAEVVPHEVSADGQQKPNFERLTLRISAAADALPGIRELRIATPRGASTIGQLVVVRDPVLAEADKNNELADAQPVTLPAALCGKIEKAEDVDCYKFQAKAGTVYRFHVLSMRLEDKIHDLQQHVDPILTLRSAQGSTLAASDNHFFADPLLVHRFEQDGEYVLEIRDVRYLGNPYWTYCIEASDRPLIEVVHPLAAQRGSSTSLQLIGHALPSPAVAELQVPADAPLGLQRAAVPIQQLACPIPLVFSELSQSVESNDAGGVPAEAQKVSLPTGINGQIGQAQDVDCFAFDAQKGEKFTFEVFARRCQSRLDPHLRILDAQGKQLALNDDARIGKRNYADSRIDDWSAPADASYVLEIRDLHLRGGAEYAYHIQCTRSKPEFALFLDTDKTNLSPGGCGTLFVRLERRGGFDGEVQLSVEGLPSGVQASCGKILSGKSQDGCIVLEAARDAPQSVADIVVTGRAVLPGEPATELTAVAEPYQEIYVPGGGRGHYPVESHAVAVGPPTDILSVKLSTQEVILAPGGSQRIDVKVERAEGFDKNVTLDVLYRHLGGVFGDSLPPGVKLDEKNSKMLLTGGETDAHLTLTADSDAAPVEQQQISVMANVSINFVMKATYSSPPLRVSVTRETGS